MQEEMVPPEIPEDSVNPRDGAELENNRESRHRYLQPAKSLQGRTQELSVLVSGESWKQEWEYKGLGGMKEESPEEILFGRIFCSTVAASASRSPVEWL